MNAHPGSNPTFSGAPKHVGTTRVAALGGTILLAGLAAFGIWTSRSGDSPSATAPEVAVAVSDVKSPNIDSIDRRGWTFYVVASEEEAAVLRANLADSEAISYALGETPLLESVYVASSDEDGAAFIAAISEGNTMNYVLGLGEDHVRDLRAR